MARSVLKGETLRNPWAMVRVPLRMPQAPEGFGVLCPIKFQTSAIVLASALAPRALATSPSRGEGGGAPRRRWCGSPHLVGPPRGRADLRFHGDRRSMTGAPPGAPPRRFLSSGHASRQTTFDRDLTSASSWRGALSGAQVESRRPPGSRCARPVRGRRTLLHLQDASGRRPLLSRMRHKRILSILCQRYIPKKKIFFRKGAEGHWVGLRLPPTRRRGFLGDFLSPLG